MNYRTEPNLKTLQKYLFTGHSVTTVSAGVIISPRRQNLLRFCPFLYILIKIFQTITQSFYIALSQNSIRRVIYYPQAYHLSAGVLFIRRRKKIRAGGAATKINSKNFEIVSVPKTRTVPKKSHSISSYIQTNYSLCLIITECYCLS